MIKKVLKILGIFLFISGIILLLVPGSQKLTGAVISTNENLNFYFSMGLTLIIIGMFILQLSKKENKDFTIKNSLNSKYRNNKSRKYYSNKS
jgi:hypothetical protein